MAPLPIYTATVGALHGTAMILGGITYFAPTFAQQDGLYIARGLRAAGGLTEVTDPAHAAFLRAEMMQRFLTSTP